MQSGGLRTKGMTKSGTPRHPLITVVTVVYNGEKTLEQTIVSVVNQTYDNIEYIIVDGASTDGTLDIIKKYEDKIDLWQSEPDGGIYDAMNKGIELANGDFCLFLGSDDILFDAYVMENASRKLCDFNQVYYGDVFLSSHRGIYDYKFSKIKLCCHNICHQSIFYPNTIYKKLEFNGRYKIYADWEYNIKAWKMTPFVYIPLMITIFCESGRSTIGDKPFLKDKNKIIRKNFGFFCLFNYVLMSPFQKMFYRLKHFFDSYRYR